MGDEAHSNKKTKLDSGSGDLKSVAEIVMVLSAMGKMRGGRVPSAVERGLMVEAREKLVSMCESSSLAPKDLVTRDAVRVLLEDLGLNRTREVMRFGFRAPKMSIAEKFSFVKKKMEESNEFAQLSTISSSQPMQVCSGANSDNHGAASNVGATHIPPDRPSTMPLSAGTFQPASPIVFVPASSLNQSQQPAFVLMPYLGSPAQTDSSSLQLPRTESAHFRLDAPPAYLSQVQASYSGDHMLESTLKSSSQSTSVTVAQVGQSVKVPDHSSPVAEVAHEVTTIQLPTQAIKDQDSKQMAVQTAPGNLQTVHQTLQGLNFVQVPSLYTNHNEIARNVQKILQTKRLDPSNWTPPPTDYMNKPLTCQMCKVTIHDVESLLVCDSCEKGVHLKCLQSYYMKGIPAADWHCPKCLLASNGKPLPPKYGRVSRSVSASKVSSNRNSVQASVEKKAENPDQKIDHQKIMANNNLGLGNAANVASVAKIHVEHAGNLKIPNAGELQGASCSVSGSNMVDQSCHEVFVNLQKERESVVCDLAGKANRNSTQEGQNGELSQHEMENSTSAAKALPRVKSESFCHEQPFDTAVDTSQQPQASRRPRDGVKTRSQTFAEVSANQMSEIDKHTSERLTRSGDPQEVSECNLGNDIKEEVQDEVQDVAQVIPNRTLDNGNEAKDCSRLSSKRETLHSVDWIGDMLRVVDEKVYYSSCCINGSVYKLQDYALFRSSSQNLSPSKIQALWEDKETRSAWAIINRCYIPDDLPEVVGRPSAPENSEVYESNNRCIIMAGLIDGPCEVLPPLRFQEEMERRSHMEHGANCGSLPVFMCRWSYDESEGHFQSITN